MWLILAPRDYLATFLKIGVIVGLALGIVVLNPELEVARMTQFIDGTGPLWKGALFPFLFITIACGAVSGFHALISWYDAETAHSFKPTRVSSATRNADGVLRGDYGAGCCVHHRTGSLLRDEYPACGPWHHHA